MHFDYFQRKSAVQVLNIIIINSLSYQSLLVWWQSIWTSREVSGGLRLVNFLLGELEVPLPASEFSFQVHLSGPQSQHICGQR